MKTKLIVTVGLALLVGAGALLLFLPREVEAESGLSKKAKELVTYLEEDHPLNLKLCALEELRRIDDTAVEAELAKVAAGSDSKLALFATTQLGKKKTAKAKSELNSILKDTKASDGVRLGAMSAIAFGWKDSDDLTDLQSIAKGNSKLSAQLTWLKKTVYRK